MGWKKEHNRINNELINLENLLNKDINKKGVGVAEKKLKNEISAIKKLVSTAETQQNLLLAKKLEENFEAAIAHKCFRILSGTWS